MTRQPMQTEAAPAAARYTAQDPILLIDRFLPRYDFAVVHAGVFRAPPEACYRLARGLDLLRDPVIRTLLGLRSLPERLVGRLPGHRAASGEGAPPPTFRLDDMVDLRSPSGWSPRGTDNG